MGRNLGYDSETSLVTIFKYGGDLISLSRSQGHCCVTSVFALGQ